MRNDRGSRAGRPALKPGVVLIVSLVLGLSALAGPARAQVRRAISLFRSTRNFIALPADARVRYEPGAESWAAMLAPLMDHAVATVEERQYRPFAEPVQVFVCASEKNFYRLSGGRTKAVVTNKLLLSPRLFQEPEYLDAYLTHELSHLHLYQRIGLIGCASLPVWFNEGLATFISGGGGAHLVSEDEALAAIKSGRHFIPDQGNPLKRRDGGSFGLEPHMFYRQSMMFVAFLHDTDPEAFREMLLKIEGRELFGKAFDESYRISLDELWGNFLEACE